MQKNSQITDPRVHVNLAHLQAMQRFAREISFLPKQPTSSVLNGQHASKLRGRGLSFEELKQYQKGDDVRTIDWKVTARTGEPHVRVYSEERDKPTLIIVDQRMSMFFGSTLNMKSVTAAEAAALSAWRIRIQGDRVGGIIFSDEHLAEFVPKASNSALNCFLSVLAKANSMLSSSSKVSSSVSLNEVLSSTVRIAKTGMMVQIFSDFHDLNEQSEVLLRQLKAHNDVILFPIFDPTSYQLPEHLQFVASDGEQQINIESSVGTTRQGIYQIAKERSQKIRTLEQKYGLTTLPLSSGKHSHEQVIRLLSEEVV